MAALGRYAVTIVYKRTVRRKQTLSLVLTKMYILKANYEPAVASLVSTSTRASFGQREQPDMCADEQSSDCCALRSLPNALARVKQMIIASAHRCEPFRDASCPWSAP